jgi:asparagine synthase (glutamine-hydrolysing)
MCGIAGIYNFQDKQVDNDLLEKMKSIILHRGPDGSGVYNNKNVGLVHTRLSIQDLSEAAHQPMWDENSQTCISYNGEIYNFKVLREELIALGVTFTSTGDTEVLLKACIQFGVEETLPKLNGMFAFAFWDDQKKELWLARDRMGIKPLYYFNDGNRFVFASEMKALIPLQNEVKPDISVLFEILNGGTSWEPYTLFSNIHALEPGSFIHLKQENSEATQLEYNSIFSHIDESLYREYAGASLQDMTDEFSRLMNDSVKIHAISDAPVATLVSGGIDSSLISTLTNKYIDGISLYHADVVGENSEKKYAKQVADHLGLNFVCAEMTEKNYVSELVDTTFYHEAPSAYHPNDVPFQIIAKRANEDNIKVLLTGEGADELFIGYGLASKQILRNKIKHTITHTPGLNKIGSLIEKIFPYSSAKSMIESLSVRGVSQAWENRANEAYGFIDNEVEKAALVHGSFYQKAHLNSLLQRNDRMGMMHSLESRIPFLENEMVKFAVNLPLKFKHPESWMSILRGNPLTRNKTVVRESARQLLPDNIIKRKKLGFPITPETYMNLNPGFYTDGFIENTLNITHKDMLRVLGSVSSDVSWNLFSTELFGKIFFMNEDKDKLKAIVNGYSHN